MWAYCCARSNVSNIQWLVTVEHRCNYMEARGGLLLISWSCQSFTEIETVSAILSVRVYIAIFSKSMTLCCSRCWGTSNRLHGGHCTIDGIQPPEVESSEDRLHVVCDTSATAPAQQGPRDIHWICHTAIMTVRDLGVMLDSKLSFGPHISELVSRCFLQLRRIKSCVQALSMDVRNTVLSSPESTTVTVCWPEFHAINSTGCSLWWTQQHD